MQELSAACRLNTPYVVNLLAHPLPITTTPSPPHQHCLLDPLHCLRHPLVYPWHSFLVTHDPNTMQITRWTRVTIGSQIYPIMPSFYSKWTRRTWTHAIQNAMPQSRQLTSWPSIQTRCPPAVYGTIFDTRPGPHSPSSHRSSPGLASHGGSDSQAISCPNGGGSSLWTP